MHITVTFKRRSNATKLNITLCKTKVSYFTMRIATVKMKPLQTSLKQMHYIGSSTSDEALTTYPQVIRIKEAHLDCGERSKI